MATEHVFFRTASLPSSKQASSHASCPIHAPTNHTLYEIFENEKEQRHNYYSKIFFTKFLSRVPEAASASAIERVGHHVERFVSLGCLSVLCQTLGQRASGQIKRWDIIPDTQLNEIK